MDPVLLGCLPADVFHHRRIDAQCFPVAFSMAELLLLCRDRLSAGSFDRPISTVWPPAMSASRSTKYWSLFPVLSFMGMMLERSGIARVLITMGRLFTVTCAAGLGLSVVIVGALFGGFTGIVGATVVTMGLLSLPAMLQAAASPHWPAASSALQECWDESFRISRVDIYGRICSPASMPRCQMQMGSLPQPRSRSVICLPAPSCRGCCSSSCI